MDKESQPTLKLIFVYNADKGWAAGLLDGAHKVLSPATYSCGLCTLTHGAFRERSAWRNFRMSHPLPMEFLYRTEFLRKYGSHFPSKPPFPVILGEGENGLRLLLGPTEINGMVDVEALINALEERLAQGLGS